MRKLFKILISVIIAAIVIAGLSTLIWWLVTRGDDEVEVETTYSTTSITTLLPETTEQTEQTGQTEQTEEPDLPELPIVIDLDGDGIGTITNRAAFTRIDGVGDLFWWFYPSTAATPVTRPLVVWLDGVTGIPPSLLANLGMIGPYDINLERRDNSWVNHCNLLFIDAPLGTGYSIPLDNTKIPRTVDENVEHLLTVLETFYSVHEEYRSAPLYIFGEADGAKSAVALAIKLNELKQTSSNSNNIQGIAIGNGIISPAVAMQQLGNYLEELAYIDYNGRSEVDNLAVETLSFVNNGNLEGAFNNFISLGKFVNENAGAIAVNLKHIVEKLTREEGADYFSRKNYIKSILGVDAFDIMNRVIGPALGINSTISYDANREDVVEAVRNSFMTPFTNQIEHILQNTDLTVTIYNGNLDAVSNTPGQLDWVNNLQWNGQTEFLNSPRRTLVVQRLVEGYFRETSRLKFYWVNAAGQSAPLDNPVAMLRLLPMMTGTE